MNNDKRVIVLVVDIDDDLGREGFNTPIIGYENVKETAISFGLKRPYDSDLNALFDALRIYNELREKGYSVEIAVVAGDYRDRVEASLKLNREIEIVKKATGFTHIFFVSDGMHDEQILPLLNSYGVVIGVERVVVEQSRSIEETYILLGRYLKKAFTEQPYTKFFLGIPGLILIAYVITSLMGFAGYIWEIIALVLGFTMFIKGFGVFEHVMNYWRVSPLIGLMMFFSIILLSYAVLVNLLIAYFYGVSIVSLKLTINLSALPLILGLMVLLSARIFYKLIKGMPGLVWRDSLLMVPLVFFMVFINNFNGELAKISDNASFDSIINLLNSQYVSLPLILSIVFSIVIALLFIMIDVFVGKKS